MAQLTSCPPPYLGPFAEWLLVGGPQNASRFVLPANTTEFHRDACVYVRDDRRRRGCLFHVDHEED